MARLNASDLGAALAPQRQTQTASRDQYGTIALDAQGTPTIKLDGGADYSPCTCLVGVHHGDRVLAHVVNHRIVVFANVTAPTTDDAQALVAIDRADAASEAADAAGVAAAAAQADADTAKQQAANAIQSAGQASQAAAQAIADAAEAKTAAEQAATAVGNAQASADDAQGSADDAADAAKTAQEEAVAANAAAYSALASLSDVENVAGVLNWIAEHGTWERTHDTTVQADKVYYSLSFSAVSEPNTHYMGRYYELSGGVYSLTDDTEPAAGTTYYEVSDQVAVVPVSTWVGNGGWYVLDGGEYIVTTDTTVQQGTTYYTRSKVYTLTSDATVDPEKDYYELVDGSYVLVMEPTDEDLGSYYELSYSYTAGTPTNDIGDYYCLNANGSIENYIASHLALMDDGLHILADGSSYRLIVTSGGIVIRDEATNRTVASYGTETVIGDVGGVHVRITEDKLEFLGSDGPDDVAAYIGMAYNYTPTTDTAIVSGKTYYEFANDAYVEVENPVLADIGSYYERHEAGTSLIIDRGIIAESLTIGNWRWDKLDDGGLMLSWIGA